MTELQSLLVGTMSPLLVGVCSFSESELVPDAWPPANRETNTSSSESSLSEIFA